MRQDIPLGRVASIPVGANRTVAVILALFAWLLGANVLPGAAAGQPAAPVLVGRLRDGCWRHCSATSSRTQCWCGTTG